MQKNGKGQKLKAGKLDKEIGFLLLDRRKRANLKQDAVANQIGVTLQQYQNYERGTNKVSFQMLFTIFRALEMNEEEQVAFIVKVINKYNELNK